MTADPVRQADAAAEAPEPSRRPAQDLVRAALYMLAAAACFAGMSAAVKAAAAEVANGVVVFFRNAVALALLLPWVALRGPRAALATRQVTGHLVRGLAGLAAMSCFFFAIARIRLADAVLLNFTIPLFLPLIERLWLGEPIPRRVGPPLAVGFAGILLILRPGPGLFQPVALLALAAAVFGALAQVSIRNMTRSEPTLRIVFYFALIGTLGSAPFLTAAWRTPPAATWVAFAATGAFATVGQVFLTRAYAAAAAGQVGPFLYTTVVFSGLVDWSIWGVLPDGLFLAGATLVVAAATRTLRRRERPPHPG